MMPLPCVHDCAMPSLYVSSSACVSVSRESWFLLGSITTDSNRILGNSRTLSSPSIWIILIYTFVNNFAYRILEHMFRIISYNINMYNFFLHESVLDAPSLLAIYIIIIFIIIIVIIIIIIIVGAQL